MIWVGLGSKNKICYLTLSWSDFNWAGFNLNTLNIQLNIIGSSWVTGKPHSWIPLDGWSWRNLTSEGYSMRNTYDLLLSQTFIRDSNLFQLLWKLKVLTKVVVFGWRSFLDKIPLKANLWKRNIITGSDNLFVVFVGGSKNLHNTFCLCVFLLITCGRSSTYC